MRRLTTVALVVTLGATSPCGVWAGMAPRDGVADADLAAWIDAAAQHAPGRADRHADTIAAWHLARQRAFKAFAPAVRDLRRGAASEVSAALARALTPTEIDRADASRLVARGLLLHTEIALAVEGRVVAAQIRPGWGTSEVSVATRDGSFSGYTLDSDHWTFARVLLDTLRTTERGVALAPAWYRAVARHHVARAAYGELGRHVRDGRQVFPRDGTLALLDGVLHQALASPPLQALRARPTLSSGPRADFGSRERELGLARKAYEDALARDPGLAEARIGLARVLADQGRDADALAALRALDPDTLDQTWQYFVALFVGDSERRLGRTEAARASFERARALAPSAQSPIVALSQLARARGDRPGALATLGALDPNAWRDDAADDPWWTFLRAAGRSAADDLRALRASLIEAAGDR